MSEAISFREFIQNNEIRIPIIQRDYAQGRDDHRANTVRKNFLSTIKDALQNNKTLELDFVYGIQETSNNPTLFIPVDGQQRLTTLFLLYWYFANLAGESDNILFLLEKFSYETRVSARNFCKFLACLILPKNTQLKPSEYIKDHQDFFSIWEFDPTVRAMLLMLDDIHQTFKDSPADFYKRLDSLKFYLYPLHKDTAAEDLYIKMNSRGRELSGFENFKAQFEKIIMDKPDEHESFTKKFDNGWLNLIWNHIDGKKEGAELDRVGINVLWNIIEIIYFKYGHGEKETTNPFKWSGKAEPDYSIIRKIFSESASAKDARNFLYMVFDKFLALKTPKMICQAFESIFVLPDSKESQEEKLVLFGLKELNFFKQSCVEQLQQANKLMYYSCIQLLGPQGFSQSAKDKARIIRNIVLNEGDMRAELLQSQISTIDSIINEDTIWSKKGFLNAHMEEEEDKIRFIEQYPQAKDLIWRFENHSSLKGSLVALTYTIMGIKTFDTKSYEKIKGVTPTALEKAFHYLKMLCGESDATALDLWGELLIEDSRYHPAAPYNSTQDRIINFNWISYYEIASYLPLLIECYQNQSTGKSEYLDKRHRKILKSRLPLLEIENPIEQLYISYVVQRRLRKDWEIGQFFQNDNFQFGIYGKGHFVSDWDEVKLELKKSHFKTKKAFQLYGSQWRRGQPFVHLPTAKELQQLEEFIKK